MSVRTRNVAGVPIVEIEKGTVARARTDRGYSLAATSARIDAVAERFEAVLDRLLDVAALELSVRRLADEIARTTRRMNALEHVVFLGSRPSARTSRSSWRSARWRTASDCGGSGRGRAGGTAMTAPTDPRSRALDAVRRLESALEERDDARDAAEDALDAARAEAEAPARRRARRRDAEGARRRAALLADSEAEATAIRVAGDAEAEELLPARVRRAGRVDRRAHAACS